MQTTFREHKKARTREAIINAAVKLFTRKGFEATTVDEIAAAAEVSRRTFFRYFPSKELVVFPHQQSYLAEFRALLADSRDGEHPFTTLRRACVKMARMYMHSREDHLLQQRIIQASPSLISRGNEFDNDWEEAIADSFADSGVKERTARYIAGAAFGVIKSALQEWYLNDCQGDLPTLGDEALSILEVGVGNTAIFAKTAKK